MKLDEFYRGLSAVVGMTVKDGVLRGYLGKAPLKGKAKLAVPTKGAVDLAVKEGYTLYSPCRESLTGYPSVTLSLTAAQLSLKVGELVSYSVMDAIDVITDETSAKSVKKSVAATKVISVKGSAKSFSDIRRVLTKATMSTKPYLVKYILTEKNEGGDNIYYRRLVAATSPLLTIVDNKLKTYESKTKKAPPVILGVKMSKKGLESLASVLHNVLDEIVNTTEGSDHPTAPFTEALLLKAKSSFDHLLSLTTEQPTLADLELASEKTEELLIFMNKNSFKKVIYTLENTSGNKPQTKQNEAPSIQEQDNAPPAKMVKPKKAVKVKKKKSKKKSKKHVADVEGHWNTPGQTSNDVIQDINTQQKGRSMYSNQPAYGAPQPQAQIGSRRIPIAGVTKQSEPVAPEGESMAPQQPQYQQHPPAQPQNQQQMEMTRLLGNEQPVDSLGYPLSGKKLKKWKKKRKELLRNIKSKMARRKVLEKELHHLNSILPPSGAPQQLPQNQWGQPRPPVGNKYTNPQANLWGTPPPPQVPPWQQQPQQQGWGQPPPPPQVAPWQQQPQQQGGWGQPPPPPQNQWGQPQQAPQWGGQQPQVAPWQQQSPQQQTITPMGQSFNAPPQQVNSNMVKQTPMGGTSNGGSVWRSTK